MRRKGLDPRSNLLSIFTPTYNSGSNINRAYKSLQAQTWRNWEWVIYDDSDLKDKGNTWNTLKKLRDSDQRIKIIKGEEHSGLIGYTKHQAATACRGKWLVELDHDDALVPELLEWVLEADSYWQDAIDFIYMDCMEPFEDTTNTYLKLPDGWGMGFGAHYWQMAHAGWGLVEVNPAINPITVWDMGGLPNHPRIWKRSFYNKIGGHNKLLAVGDDYDILIRTFLHGSMLKMARMGYIQYRGNTATNERSEEINQLSQELKEHYTAPILERFKELNINYEKTAEKYQSGSIAYFQVPDTLPTIYPTHPLPHHRVSIIMPTYNRPRTLARAIASVMNQTFEDWELLIVGDCCPSLDYFMNDYSDLRIKWYNLGDRYGPGGATARNYALKYMCNTELIAYLDDDNYWEQNHLESLMKIMGDNDFVFSSINFDGEICICDEPKLYRIDTSAILHKRQLLLNKGYWQERPAVGYAHDWELVSRWLEYKWEASLQPTLHFDNQFSNQNVKAMIRYYDD